jgi:hypothetical protein
MPTDDERFRYQASARSHSRLHFGYGALLFRIQYRVTEYSVETITTASVEHVAQ